MKQYLFPSARTTQHGSTLIEVLVSMFILALGVMALLAMQVRTSAGTKEAENMSIVAQAAQNLVEGMMINPTLSLDDTIIPPQTKKDYSEYYKDCPNNAASAAGSLSGDVGRDTLVTAQKNRFCATIQGIQGAEDIKVKPLAASDAIVVTWVMKTDGSASGVPYSYTATLDD